MGGLNPQITCNIMSSKFLKRRDFLWDKNTTECKIRSLGLVFLRKQNFVEGEGLKPNLMFSKYALNRVGAVKKLL